MIFETPNLPRKLLPENTFIISLKSELRKHAQEINRLQRFSDFGIIEKQSIYDFPNIGEDGVFYIDKTNNKIYRWDGSTNSYCCIGSDYNDISVISGGGA